MTIRKRRDSDGWKRGESGFGSSDDLKVNRGTKPYEEQVPAHDIFKDVDKNQEVNGGLSGGIPFGTD